MQAVHVLGTRNILDAVDGGACIVHTSSVVTIGASRDGRHLSEDNPFNLDGCAIDYVLTKRAAEQIALDAAVRGQGVIVTNPGYLVGPDDYEQSAMGRLCVRFWKGRMPLAPPGGINIADVRDVATGHLLAAEHGQRGRRYILGGENLSWTDIMSLLSAVGGFRPRAVPRVPAWLLGTFAALGEARAWWTQREPYPSFQHARLNRYYWFYRSDRAAAELGYESRSVAASLVDAYEWHSQTARTIPRRLAQRGLNRWWMRPAASA
jgi:dihydroflavonol-4-reductase